MKVYILRSGDLWKIGVSENLPLRIGALQASSSNPTGRPIKLQLVSALEFPSRAAAFYFEKSLHGLLEEYRESGEWFWQIPEDAWADACLRAGLLWMDATEESEDYEAAEALADEYESLTEQQLQ